MSIEILDRISQKMIGDILETVIGILFETLPDIVWEGIRRVGVLVRLPFMKEKSFSKVLKLSWNGSIGLVFLITLSITIWVLIS